MVTGNDVRRVREALGLTQAVFAVVLSVAVSSIARWEGAGDQLIRADPRSEHLLIGLMGALDQRTEKERQELVSSLKSAVITGGSLFVLFLLLRWIFADRQ